MTRIMMYRLLTVVVAVCSSGSAQVEFSSPNSVIELVTGVLHRGMYGDLLAGRWRRATSTDANVWEEAPGAHGLLLGAQPSLRSQLAVIQQLLGLQQHRLDELAAWQRQAIDVVSRGLVPSQRLTRSIDGNSWAIAAAADRLSYYESAIIASTQSLTRLNAAAPAGLIVASSNAMPYLQTLATTTTYAAALATLSSAITRAASVDSLSSALPGCSVTHGATVYHAQWHPSGDFLAISGDNTGSPNYIGARTYRFNGTSLTALSGCSVTTYSTIMCTAWHPSGNYLALCGRNFYSSTYDVVVYAFNATPGAESLTVINGTRLNVGNTAVNVVAWHPTGQFLAIGGNNYSSPQNDLRVYAFNSTPGSESLSDISGCRRNDGTVYALSWSSDGRYLAEGMHASPDVRVFEFVGQVSLTQRASATLSYESDAVCWSTDDEYLYVGTADGDVQAYEFTGASLNAVGGSYSMGASVESIVADAQAPLIFVGATYSAGYNNICGLTFDGSTLTKNTSASVTQGTSTVYELALRTGGGYLAAVGTATGSVDIKVYPINRTLACDLMEATSYALISLITPLVTNSLNIAAQSDALVTLRRLVDANSSAAYTTSWAIAAINARTIADSSALSVHSASIISLASPVAADELATIAASNAVAAHSWSLAAVQGIYSAYEATLVTHSNAVVSLNERVVANSNALNSGSWAVVGFVRSCAPANSNAVVARTGSVNASSTALLQDSWALAAAANLTTVKESCCVANSLAIIALCDKRSHIYNLVWENCSALTAQSSTLAHVEELTSATSWLNYATSWGVPGLKPEIEAHSSVVTTFPVVGNTSWAVVVLEDRIDRIETSLYANSLATVAHSAALSSANQLMLGTSWALISLHEQQPLVEQLMTAHSWAVLHGVDNPLIIENSHAVVSLASRLPTRTISIGANSVAVVSQQERLAHVETLVDANNAATVTRELYLATTLPELIEGVSWTIVWFQEAACELVDEIAGTSNAIIANSAALTRLAFRLTANSNAVLASSTAVLALNDLVDDTSSALVQFSDLYTSVDGLVTTNSWAIAAFNDCEMGLLRSTSSAIRGCGEQYDALSVLVVGTRDAVQAHSTAVVSLGAVCAADSQALVTHVNAVLYGQPTDLMGPLAGMGITHGADIHAVAWNPDGNYVAIAGSVTDSVSIRVYRYNANAQTLTQVATANHGAEVRALAWHPSGRYLAIAGDRTSSVAGRIYSFDGDSLSLITACNMTGIASDGYAIVWHPSGDYIAVGGTGFGTTSDLRLFAFNDTVGSESIAALSDGDLNLGYTVRSLAFDPSGTYVLMGGLGTGSSVNVQLYQFVGGTMLSELTGCRVIADTQVNTVGWLADARYMVVGTEQAYLHLYRFADSSFTTVTSVATATRVNHLTVNDDGRFLFVGMDLSSNINARLYAFDLFKQSLTEVATCAFGQGTGRLLGIGLSPDMRSVTAVGQSTGSTNGQTYRVVYSSLVSSTSWAVLALGDMVNSPEAAVAQSAAVVTINTEFDRQCTGVMANSSAIVVLDTLLNANSAAHLTTSQALASTSAIARLCLHNSHAEVGHLNRILADSSAIVSLDERVLTHSCAIIAYSTSLVALHDQIVADSELHNSTSWALKALHERTDAMAGMLERLGVYLGTSWAIIALEDRVQDIEEVVGATSSAVVAQANMLTGLSDRIVANSSASVGLQAWSAGMITLLQESSNAVVQVEDYLGCTSNAVVQLDANVTAFEAIIAADSSALRAASTAIINRVNKITVDSWAIRAFSDRLSQSFVDALMIANSMAINTVMQPPMLLITDNSQRVLATSAMLDAVTEQVAATSSAAIAQQQEHATTASLIGANSVAISATNEFFKSIEQSLVEDSNALVAIGNALDLEGASSWALVALHEQCQRAAADSLATNNFLVQNSWAMMAIADLDCATSGAVLSLVHELNQGALIGVDAVIPAMTISHGATVNSVAWHNSYIAIGGAVTSNVSIRVWRAVEDAISELTGCRADHGATVNSVSWHPSGNYLAVCGDCASSRCIVRVYAFNGTTLTECVGCRLTPWLLGSANQCAWHPSGNSLAVVGNNISGTADVAVYSFDATPGSEALTLLPNSVFNHTRELYCLGWNSAGTYLAVGGDNALWTSYNVRVLSFDGTTLTPLQDTYTDYADGVWSIQWVDGSNRFFACDDGDLRLYELSGDALGELTSARTDLGFTTNDLAIIGGNRGLVVGTNGSGSYNAHVFAYDAVAAMLVPVSGGAIAQNSGNVMAVTVRPDALRIVVAGETTIGTYPLVYDSLMANNSWAVLALVDDYEPVSQLMVDNSWSIRAVYEKLNMIVTNSFAIVGLNERLAFDVALSMATSSVLCANSQAILHERDSVVAASNAIYAQSWSVLYLADRIIVDSRAASANSSAVVTLADDLDELLDTEYDTAIAILNRGDYRRRADLHLHDAVTTVSYDLSLSMQHRLVVEDDVVIDGEGHDIGFVGAAGLCLVDGKNLQISNAYLYNFTDAAVVRGSASSLVFADGTTIELTTNQELAETWTFAGDTMLLGDNKTLTLLPNGRIYVAPSSSLTIHDLAIVNIEPLSILCAPTSSIIFDNVALTIPTRYPFTTGSLCINELAITNGIFSYESSLASTILANGLLLLSNLTFSCHAQPLIFTDSSSRLQLSSSVVHVAPSGLTLTKGRLVVTGRNYIDAPATTISLGNTMAADNLYVTIDPGGSLELCSGTLNYLNDE